MSTLFIDTSSLAKRYVIETGSKWLRQLVAPRSGNIIVISKLAIVEITSLLMRRQREGLISLTTANLIAVGFLVHVDEQYLAAEIDDPVLSLGQMLLTRHRLRALDAIQLASALHFTTEMNIPITFIASDKNLLAAAAAEGLQTDDPNLHP